MQPHVASVNDSRNLIKAILITGFIAGTLDALAAGVVSQVSFTRLFQFIASGAFGREEAFAGGTTMILWGILFHYFIAYFWTTLFFLAYPRVPLLQKNKYIVGLFYGVLVWLIMNLLVLPMSQIVQREFSWAGAIRGTVILMLMIGLPISIMANRFYKKPLAIGH
jgi:hypothetical protein